MSVRVYTISHSTGVRLCPGLVSGFMVLPPAPPSPETTPPFLKGFPPTVEENESIHGAPPQTPERVG